jgi:hypothetical protein
VDAAATGVMEPRCFASQVAPRWSGGWVRVIGSLRSRPAVPVSFIEESVVAVTNALRLLRMTVWVAVAFIIDAMLDQE